MSPQYHWRQQLFIDHRLFIDILHSKHRPSHHRHGTDHWLLLSAICHNARRRFSCREFPWQQWRHCAHGRPSLHSDAHFLAALQQPLIPTVATNNITALRKGMKRLGNVNQVDSIHRKQVYSLLHCHHKLRSHVEQLSRQIGLSVTAFANRKTSAELLVIAHCALQLHLISFSLAFIFVYSAHQRSGEVE